MGAGASIDVFSPGELEGELQAIDATSPASSWELFKAGYDSIVHTIIRPPRHEYNDNALGPQDFEFDTTMRIKRHDFIAFSSKHEAMQCSVWDTEQGQSSCVLYLHGISGSRVEALSLLGPVLQMGHALASFDFRGSGKSDGKYISMGYTEHHDVMTVLRLLHEYRHGKFKSVNVWGRCMGANAAILLLSQGILQKRRISMSVPLDSIDFSVHSIAGVECLVVASTKLPAQSDVQVGDVLMEVDKHDLCRVSSGQALSILADCNGKTSITLSGLRQGDDDISKSFVEWMVSAAQTDGWQIPSFLVSAGISLLRSSIQRSANFDIHAVAPAKRIDKCMIPAVFLHGTQDFFVPYRHSELNVKEYGSRIKSLVPFKGTHDSLRSRSLVESILTRLHVATSNTESGKSISMTELFPQSIVYPTWSASSTWKEEQEKQAIDADMTIAPFTAFSTNYMEVENHIAYSINVFAPPNMYTRYEGETIFGEKNKQQYVREGSATIVSEEREVKSFWKNFATQVKGPSRRTSWFGKWRRPQDEKVNTWKNLAEPNESDVKTVTQPVQQDGEPSQVPTFVVSRRCHDLKLLLTKLSAMPGGLSTELQVIRSKLVYSTKIGPARLEERKQLLNEMLEIITSTPALWNKPVVHQFLCLDRALEPVK